MPGPRKRLAIPQLNVVVHRDDFHGIVTGQYREFRLPVARATKVDPELLPMLVRILTTPSTHRVMVLEAVREEKLGNITDEGLAAAGYTGPQAFDAFRRDWKLRRQGFEPNLLTRVYTVRPATAEDWMTIGRRAMNFLYGEPDAPSSTERPRAITAYV